MFVVRVYSLVLGPGSTRITSQAVLQLMSAVHAKERSCKILCSRNTENSSV